MLSSVVSAASRLRCTSILNRTKNFSSVKTNTLQFAAIPLNLLGKPGNWRTTHYKTANYVRNGHWSEKARDEARMYCHVNEVNLDPEDLYVAVPDGKDWDIDPKGAYIHYTAADTRQGFEFQDFPYDAIPEGMTLCCDASA